MEPLIPGLPDEVAFECLARVSYDDFPAISSVCRRWRHELYSPELHRYRHLAGFRRPIVALHGRYIGYEYSPYVSLFNPTSSHGFQLLPVPHELTIFNIAAAGLCLVVVGKLPGVDAVCQIYIYNFLSGSWRRGAPMPGQPRVRFAFASDGERWVFVAGGIGVWGSYLISAMAYDVAEDKWVPMPDMRHMSIGLHDFCDSCNGAFCDGTFHVYSTITLARSFTIAQGFNIASWQWGPMDTAELPADTYPYDCLVACDGRMYVCSYHHLLVKYGPTWRVISNLPVDLRGRTSLSTWLGDLLISGQLSYEDPRKAFTLALGDESKWLSLQEADEVPMPFRASGARGCWLEI